MTSEQSRRLRELALAVTRGELRRPWTVQTSNSFRRIGTDRGDGDVLCAVTQKADGHPDLHAAPDVLDYIVAAHPLVVLELLDERVGKTLAPTEWIDTLVAKAEGRCLGTISSTFVACGEAGNYCSLACQLRSQLSVLQAALRESLDLLDLRYQEDPGSRDREELRIAELRKLGAKP